MSSLPTSTDPPRSVADQVPPPRSLPSLAASASRSRPRPSPGFPIPGIAALYGTGRYPREDGRSLPRPRVRRGRGAPRLGAAPRGCAEKLALLAELCEAVEHAAPARA
ncbi:MAG: hypothetical protein RML12_02940 [Xanthomonadales bacterium]|nr:hypothetical protein [Xanthomonadales bacterium]